MRRYPFRLLVIAFLTAILAGLPSLAQAAGGSFLGGLNPTPVFTASTVPAGIGDGNPYGVAVVPETRGALVKGDVLVSNFNSSSGLQGTGTTIMEISPTGNAHLFANLPSTIGLTTALVVLRSGWVIVGNLPTTYDTNNNPIHIGAGSLTVLDSMGRVAESFTDPRFIDGPWDATALDGGVVSVLFYSNVLNGTVVRTLLVTPPGRKPIFAAVTQIGSGYAHRTDPAALVVGPTGVALARNGTLYVVSTTDNTVYGIPNALFRPSDGGKGMTVYQDQAHLRGPLGLTIVPNGDLLMSNGDAVNPDASFPSELIEATPGGHFVAQLSLDPNPGGAFGLALTPDGAGLYAVDDNTNTLNLLR